MPHEPTGGDERTMIPGKRIENVNVAESASRILRTLSGEEVFHFYTEIEENTGEFAVSLADFYEKLKTIPLKAIEFHFKRGDFERWIKETLGDEQLANGTGKIDKSVHGEVLRIVLEMHVESRLRHLRQSQL
jgi:hypothetical protein